MQKDFQDALLADLGKGPFVSWFCELLLLERDIDHTIQHLKKWTDDKVVDTPMLVGPGKSKIVYEPYGVVLIMGSWNFPFYTTLGPLIYVIAAGNCAVIKPSEISINCCRKMKSLVTRYLDMSCFVCIEGGVEVAKALTSKPFDCIVFTGSTEKGKLVAASAAKNLVPCVLELGGKSPSIVDLSADLPFAAKKIVFGRFLNSGQVCISPDYVLIHQSLIDQFIPLLEQEIRSQWSGGSNLEDMGRIVNDFHKNRLCSLLENHGGRVVIGNANAYEDKLLQPTVVVNPQRESALMKDEIFGPILPVITYDSFDEVIKFINEGDKPLSLYYFGKANGHNYKRVERETSSGSLVTNEVLFQNFNPDLPFGGVGASGYGRIHGFEGFKSFSNAKSVLIKSPLTMYPYNKVYPPFTKDKQSFLKFLVKMTQGTQAAAAKKLIGLIVAIFILQAIARGKLNRKTFVNIKNTAVLLFNLMKYSLTNKQ